MRIWLILNRASRAVGDDWESTLVTECERRGWQVTGTTDFPHDDVPGHSAIAEARIDMVVVAAGDGTINAVARALDDWDGMLLVLPGGTMNLLAKALHDSVDPVAILAALADPPMTRRLPTVDAGEHRAVVGAILGPGASWVHAREAVRNGRWHRLLRTLRFAYMRSLSHAVRLRRGARRSKGYRAIFIHPGETALSVVKVSASGWTDGMRLGFGYLTGTWETARGIETGDAEQLQLADTRPTFALFDGEPLRLPRHATITRGETRLRFVATR